MCKFSSLSTALKHQTVEAEILDASLYVMEKLGKVSEGSRAWIKPNTFSRWGNCSTLRIAERSLLPKAGLAIACPGGHPRRTLHLLLNSVSSYCWRNSLYEATGFISIPRHMCSLSAVLIYGLKCCWNYKGSRVRLLYVLGWEWGVSFCCPTMAIFFLSGWKRQLRSGTLFHCVKTG